jgi:TolA-binding protein
MAGLIWLGTGAPSQAAREAKGVLPGSAADQDAQTAALRQIKAAEDAFATNESERGIKMLEAVIDQFPNSPMRFKAYLVLGKHFIDDHKEKDAVRYLRNIETLEKNGETLQGDLRDIYLEGMYLLGIANYQTGQYASAFPILRKITRDYPNTIWANQAYYYIGMCHFLQGNWQKAVEALSLVGTFVDADSPTIQYMEAGRRFYVKVTDADLPVLARLGKKITVTVATKAGDKETIECIPMAGKGDVFIGSIPTEIGVAKPGDNVLQVIGGDEVTVTYIDNNTQDGSKDGPRTAKVKVVSTGALEFTQGTFEARAVAAFLDQPLYVLLEDEDEDVTPGRDLVQIKVISRYRDYEAEEAAKDQQKIDFEKILSFEQDLRRYKTRGEITLTLTELGEGPVVRTGRFGGTIMLSSGTATGTTNNMPILPCQTGDEIIATYVDKDWIGGETPREVTATIAVSGEIENRPMATQYVVSDPVVRARRNLVEGSAYLELGRIFRSMGLTAQAATKCDAGLALVAGIIRSSDQIPPSLSEEAFHLKWDLEILKEDYNGAIATCQLFNRLFPQSPLVDQALLGIGRIHTERKEYDQAIAVFQQIINLPTSLAKAEAQFHIAEAVEARAAMNGRNADKFAAIPYYKTCAEKYPDSEYAGTSLGKLVDYYVENKDFAQAEDLLTQIFQDHPDANFLDSMLLKWVIVAYRMGDFAKANEKCTRLLFEYPESPYAEKAKALLPRLQEKMQSPAADKTAPAAEKTTPGAAS